MNATLLIVDDEKNTREGLRLSLEEHFEVYLAADAAQAMTVLQNDKVDVMLTDLRLGADDGMQLIEKALKLPEPPLCVMMTAYGSVDTAVEAVKRGAWDFITKPLNLDELELLIKRALKERRLESENKQLRRVVTEQAGFRQLLGRSKAMEDVMAVIRQVAPTKANVLIEGESGTGKELAARALHDQSARAGGPFIALNCAAVPESAAETILFGHAQGAIAHDAPGRIGKLEAANGGTLMLDEVETLPPPVQAKLLRVLQERQVERIGETQPRALDIRVIATTKTDLRTVEGFRPDLYFRLAATVLQLPTMHEAAEDIPLLFVHYAQLAARRYGRPDPEVSWALGQQLRKRAWPGNIRELKAVAEAYALGLHSLPTVDSAVPGKETLAERVAEFEAREIAVVLERHKGNTLRTAETLGLPRRTLNDKMRRYGLGGLDS